MRRVRPYYLYQCDPITGSSHFRTTVRQGARDHPGPARPHDRLCRADLRGRRAGRRRQDPAHSRLCRRAATATTSCSGISKARPTAIPTRTGRSARTGRLTPARSDARRSRLRPPRRLSRARAFRGGDRRVRLASRRSISSPLRSRRWAARSRASAAARRWRRGLSQATRYDLVFSIAEGVKGRSREAQVPALCELFDQPYLFSDPLTLAACSRQGGGQAPRPRRRRADASFAVAERNANELLDWADFPAFVKPLAEGTGKGLRGRLARATLKPSCMKRSPACIERYRQPALVETLSSRPRVHGRHRRQRNRARACSGSARSCCKPNAEANVYSLHNKELCEDLVTYAPADDGEARLAGTRALRRLSGARVP